jgi:hypothetical protein
LQVTAHIAVGAGGTFESCRGTPFDTHLWLDADSAARRALAESAQITAAHLPAVMTGDQVLCRATTEQMAQALGAWRTGTPEPSRWT